MLLLIALPSSLKNIEDLLNQKNFRFRHNRTLADITEYQLPISESLEEWLEMKEHGE